MGAGFISYKIENDRAFQEQVKSAVEILGDLRIPFGDIAKDFYKSRKAIFNLKGPGQYPPFKGPKIKDLWAKSRFPRPNMRTRDGSKTSYQDWKFRKFGFDYPLLKATGRLERSITGPGPDSILIIDKKVLAIGTRVPYGIYHQSDESRKKMPLRKFLFIGNEASGADEERQLGRWAKIIETYLNRKLGATFLQATGKAGK